MTEYRYETHLHTAETSRCSKSSGAELARYFKSLGYTGVFVTDHFLNSNTTVAPDLPWAERIELFCRGYELTAEEGAKLGLDVFFGWEYGYGWTHILTYGLGKDWLLDNPEVLSWSLPDYLDRVHEDGGSIVHAHPFREGVETVLLLPAKIDAVETINSGRTDEANRHAYDFAVSFNLPQTAGSDIHRAGQNRLCGITCSQRLKNANDYIEIVKSGQMSIFDNIRQC